MKIDIPECSAWNNPEYPDVTAVNVFDHKDGECIAYVFDDGGRVHLAVQIGAAVIAADLSEKYKGSVPPFFGATTRRRDL